MDWMDTAAEWAGEHAWLLGGLAAASVVLLVASAAMLPWVIGRLPSDYFAHEKRSPSLWTDRHPAVRWSLLVGKNVLGGVLIAAGIVMLVAPGQGILTIAVGLLLLDFPGKYRIEKRVASHPRVLRGLNWVRGRRGRPPLRVDDRGGDS